MGFREWWNGERHAAPVPRVVNPARMVSTWLTGRPLDLATSYPDLVATFYARNQVIFACVEELSSSAAEPIPQTYVNDEVDLAHDLTQLLLKPNDDQDFFDLASQCTVYWLCGGHIFLQKLRTTAGQVAQLRALRPDRVKPVYSGDGVALLGYEYWLDGVVTNRFLPRDIIWRRAMHPAHDTEGLSRLQVAAQIADLDNQSIDFLRAIFANGGMPKGLIKFKRKLKDKAEADAARTRWDDNYSGREGWQRTAILDDDADYTRLGFDLKEADVSSVLGVTECRQCSVFGVPPILVAARVGLEHATYSNYESARKALWEQTLSPYFRAFGSMLTRGLAPEFTRGREVVRVGWNMKDVRGLNESQDSLNKRAIEGYKAGLKTRNEARAMVGDEPDLNGDVYRSDLSAIDEPAVFEQQTRQQRSIEAASNLRTQLRLEQRRQQEAA